MFPMSSTRDSRTLGLDEDEAALLGPDRATRIRTFRLIVVLAQELRALMDQLLRADGLTTQQAALITVVEAIGAPSLSQAAAALGTTHQNAKQIATALERKGFLRIDPDEGDRRVRRLVTTDKSRAYWKQRSPTDYQHVLEWFADLTEREAETLFELLLRVERTTRAALDRDGPPSAAPPRPG
jgi:DNA-binding MarR family transcriptional regulator